MWSPEFHALVKREQDRDDRAVQAEDRVARALLRAERDQGADGRGLGRRFMARLAAPLGGALLQLGLRCVRVGAELKVYASSARS